MRIVFLLQDTGKVYGAERATLDLAHGLRAAGEEVSLLLIEESRLGANAGALRVALQERSLPFDTIRVAGRLSPALIKAVRERVRLSGADVLHTTGYKADLHGGWAAGWGRHVPVVSTVHGWLFRPEAKERFYGWLNVLALRRFSRVISLSQHYDRLLAQRGIPRERLVRIPSGLALAACRAGLWPPAGQPFTIGLSGRLSWEKNHDLFLRAARRVVDAGADVRFLIAGDGPLAADLRSQISDLKLDGRVDLAGYLSRDEFLSRVHAVSLCSRMENLPYSVLEAMAWSRPVVATRVGGLPDLVENGVTGWLVEAGDEQGLAERLLQLAREPAAGRALGEGGHRKLEREFTLAAMVERHRSLYRELSVQ